MAEYLIFQLAATLASMGEFAGHERRGSLTWPGQSALLGLCGAALGIRRDGDFAALDDLQFSVAVFSAGDVLRDYHTIETVPSAAARTPQSRPEALKRAKGRTNTTITLRDYRMGALFGVAVEGNSLETLRAALRQPVFPLYLGRKSCPLSAPTNPEIVTADSAEAALRQLSLPPWHQGEVAHLLVCDKREDVAQHIQRHDVALDRSRWHFAAREVSLVSVDISPETPT